MEATPVKRATPVGIILSTAVAEVVVKDLKAYEQLLTDKLLVLRHGRGYPFKLFPAAHQVRCAAASAGRESEGLDYATSNGSGSLDGLSQYVSGDRSVGSARARVVYNITDCQNEALCGRR
jgi:hypothetical protein